MCLRDFAQEVARLNSVFTGLSGVIKALEKENGGDQSPDAMSDILSVIALLATFQCKESCHQTYEWLSCSKPFLNRVHY